jgi:hypothetical protein
MGGGVTMLTHHAFLTHLAHFGMIRRLHFAVLTHFRIITMFARHAFFIGFAHF